MEGDTHVREHGADAVPVADAVHNLSYLLDTPIAIRVREKRGKGLED